MSSSQGVVNAYWSGSSTVSGVFPVNFELVFTNDLPNGPYGELGGSGSGKLYVPPGSTYNDVAGALISAWIKSRGTMMQMTVKVRGAASSQYSEDWRVKAIEFKGGAVDPRQNAAAGMHGAQLGIIQAVKPQCCTIS